MPAASTQARCEATPGRGETQASTKEWLPSMRGAPDAGTRAGAPDAGFDAGPPDAGFDAGPPGPDAGPIIHHDQRPLAYPEAACLGIAAPACAGCHFRDGVWYLLPRGVPPSPPDIPPAPYEQACGVPRH